MFQQTNLQSKLNFQNEFLFYREITRTFRFEIQLLIFYFYENNKEYFYVSLQNIFPYIRREFGFLVITKYNDREMLVFLIKYDKANYEKQRNKRVIYMKFRNGILRITSSLYKTSYVFFYDVKRI